MFSSNGSQVSSVANYIENVFSTYLYTGNGSTQTITNNIDLSTYGGLVWYKSRSSGTWNHGLFDTARGVNNQLFSNSTSAQGTYSGVTAFNTNGFSIGSDNGGNESGGTMASWTFRKQPKFFDVVTYTGTGSVQNISHNLNSAPGCIIVKRTDTTGNWAVYHRSLNEFRYISLNLTTGETISSAYWNNTAPTSTQFTVGTSSDVNASSGTYVAYLFAHNDGGFGLLGTDNVITCGQFATNGAGNATVDLGYEPQWVMTKRRDSTGSWAMFDSMRGLTTDGSNDALLLANSSIAEGAASYIGVTSTGLAIASGAYSPSATYIYIAIRRGPMAVPTDATKVFSPLTYTGTGANNTIVGFGFPPDLVVPTSRDAYSGYGSAFADKLRGPYQTLKSSSTSSEDTITNGLLSFDQDGISVGPDNAVGYINWNTKPYVFWNFRRAPSFFDEVCYTGTGSQQNITHNLSVAPELIIVKRRSAAGTSWATWVTSLTADQSLALNTTDDKNAVFSVGFWGSTYPTSSVFTVGSNINTNSNAQTYVAYLFATCAGVSKVGSYTGNGTSQAIACGFTGGARFVLIKRTDASGNWGVLDTARGMVSGTDPYLNLNTTAAEVNANNLYTTTGGFQLVSSDANFNANGGSYIFLAVA